MQSEIQTACYSSFEDYVGKSYDESQYEASTLTPTENSWAQGDRTITCTLVTLNQIGRASCRERV